MKLERFSDLVLRLTACAVDMAPADYRQRMVALLREAVDFDSAWWGWSSFAGNRVNIVNSGRYRMPPEFEAAAKAVAPIDPFIRHGRNLAVFALTLTPRDAAVPEDYMGFTERFGIATMMNGHCRLDQSSAYNFFMSIYRGPERPVFEPQDAANFQIILRHLEQGLSLSVRTELRARAGRSGEAALFDDDAQIVRATPGFDALLEQEGLSTRQTASLLKHIVRQGGHRRGRNLVLEAETYKPGLTFVRVARLALWHRLSVQERRVAERLTAGASAQQIAEDFGVSPNTVRNQIASIYRKLEVKSRIELLQRLSGET